MTVFRHRRPKTEFMTGPHRPPSNYKLWAGLVQFVENLARCTLMDRLLLCDLVSSHIFPWAHTGPYISIYRTGADGVRSCLATKPISTSYRSFAFSFDNFFFALSLLKSSYFFFERGLRHIFYVKGENIQPPHPSIFLGKHVHAPRSGWLIHTNIRPRSLKL